MRTGGRRLCNAVAKLLAQKYTAESCSSASWILSGVFSFRPLSRKSVLRQLRIIHCSFILKANQKPQAPSLGLPVPVKGSVARTRITPQSHGLSFLCDLMTGGLGDSTLCEPRDRERQNLKMEPGNGSNNHWRVRCRDLGALRTHPHPGDRGSHSTGTWCPWQGRDRNGRFSRSGSL